MKRLSPTHFANLIRSTEIVQPEPLGVELVIQSPPSRFFLECSLFWEMLETGSAR